MHDDLNTESQSDEAGRIACRYCGSVSRTKDRYCWYCWAVISDPIADLAEAARLRDRIRRGRLARRVVRLGLLFGGLIAIALYSTGEIMNRPVPLPSSNISAVVASDAWSVIGRDVAHTARIPVGNAIQGELRWKLQTESELLSSPVLVDGIVYIGTGDSRFLALDVNTGEVLWARATTGPLSTSPAVTANDVYIGLRDGQLWALGRFDGEPRWIVHTEVNISTSPIVHNGVLYVGFGDGMLRAFDAENGLELWSYDTGNWVTGAPVIRGTILAVVNQDGEVHLVDLITGQKRLDYAVNNVTKDPPAFAGDKLIVTSDRGQLTVLDSTKLEYVLEKRFRVIRMELFMMGIQGSPPVKKGWVWGIQFPEGVPLSAPSVATDRLYVNTREGRLYALELETGEIIWDYDAQEHYGNKDESELEDHASELIAAVASGELTAQQARARLAAYSRGEQSNTSPAVVGDFVYMGTESGNIHVVNRHDGIAKHVFQADGPLRGQIVVADDTLLVSSQYGALYAFD